MKEVVEGKVVACLGQLASGHQRPARRELNHRDTCRLSPLPLAGHERPARESLSPFLSVALPVPVRGALTGNSDNWAAEASVYYGCRAVTR